MSATSQSYKRYHVILPRQPFVYLRIPGTPSSFQYSSETQVIVRNDCHCFVKLIGCTLLTLLIFVALMTVTYTAKVASSKTFGCFWKLLFLWKGSIYKLLWPNLVAYFVMYSSLSICYRFLLDEPNKHTFEMLSLHCQKYGELIPVSFVLGFYVTIVVSRWWDQYTSIPWPDSFAIFVSSFINGADDHSRMLRRTIMRYANLSLVMVFIMISTPAKKRFPTLDHLQEAGFMLPNERKILEKMDEKTKHPKFWVPLLWATALISEARRDDFIKDDFGLKTLIDEAIKFRSGCGSLLNFDWISIPLVYTQVVTLAVYTYFLATLMGNQYLNPSKGYPNHTIDLVVPIFTLLQFFFYMGWLLVAETLVNPFGEDDDDFEVNWLIDRNLQISYMIVDEVHENHPDLMKDPYWEEVVPDELPYTEAAKPTHTEPFLGSTRYVDVPLDQRNFVLMSIVAESEEMSANTVIDRSTRRETAPVEIISTAKGDYISSILGSRKGSHSSGNSFVRLVRANIYGSNSSDKSLGSANGETNRPKRKKLSAISAPSRPFSLESVSNRRDSVDYLEDIFRMSDFSLRESSCKVIEAQKTSNEKGGFVDCLGEQPKSYNSVHTGSPGPYHEVSRRNMTGHFDLARMSSWIENTNTPFSTSFERFGTSFGAKVTPNNLRGEGELYMSEMDNVDEAAGSTRPPVEEMLQKPPEVVMGTVQQIGISRKSSKSVVDDELKGHIGEEKDSSPAGDDPEMIVPLDEQILLYSSRSLTEVEAVDALSESDMPDVTTERSIILDKTDNSVEALKFGFKGHPQLEIRKDAEVPVEEEKASPEEDSVFERPEPSRAIDIPGCAESMEHRCLPVITYESQGITWQISDESLPSRARKFPLNSATDVPNYDDERQLCLEPVNRQVSQESSGLIQLSKPINIPSATLDQAPHPFTRDDSELS